MKPSVLGLALATNDMKTRGALAVAGLSLRASFSTVAAERVTVDNFVPAEIDLPLDRYARHEAFGKFLGEHGVLVSMAELAMESVEQCVQ